MSGQSFKLSLHDTLEYFNGSRCQVTGCEGRLKSKWATNLETFLTYLLFQQERSNRTFEKKINFWLMLIVFDPILTIIYDTILVRACQESILTIQSQTKDTFSLTCYYYSIRAFFFEKYQ